MHAKISEESNRVYLQELHKIIDEISKKKKSPKIFGGSLDVPTFATQNFQEVSHSEFIVSKTCNSLPNIYWHLKVFRHLLKQPVQIFLPTSEKYVK